MEIYNRGVNIEIAVTKFNNRVPESLTKLDTTLNVKTPFEKRT